MRIDNLLKLSYGKLRRQFLVRFRPRKVQAVLAERQGECAQCANCCRLLLKCPFLTADNLCRIYGSSLRPKSCVHFPLGRLDLEDVRISSNKPCGYKF